MLSVGLSLRSRPPSKDPLERPANVPGTREEESCGW